MNKEQKEAWQPGEPGWVSCSDNGISQVKDGVRSCLGLPCVVWWKHRAGRTGLTFGGLAVPDHEGAQHVARGQELALCIFSADALEEPPGGKGGGSV